MRGKVIPRFLPLLEEFLDHAVKVFGVILAMRGRFGKILRDESAVRRVSGCGLRGAM